MGRRNPVAQALRKLGKRVVPNKKRKAKEADNGGEERDFLENWYEQDDPTYCPGCGNELMYCMCWDGRQS